MPPMRPNAAVAAALAAVVAALPACSSSYIPQARGRVSLVMMNGAPAYVRDGQVIAHGFLGSGLERAVRGNPAAERAARQYRTRLRDGLLVGVGGLVCSTIAGAMGAARMNEAQEGFDDDDDEQVPMEIWLSLGCFVASMGGLGYAISADPLRYDAINIFNDTTPSWVPGMPGTPGMPGGPAHGPPGGYSLAPAAGAARPTESLHMRD